MKISDVGEFGLIERIRRASASRPRKAPIGIGDDAAALSVSPGMLLLATTDMLLEGVHFDLRTTDLASLGWKAAAVNLSDIAAMGGAPQFCLTALGVPASLAVEDVAAFYRGLHACLKPHRTLLVGGDTCRSRNGLVISITLLGEAKRTKAVRRSGARPGDLLFVTGTLGDSAAGLELLRTGGRGTEARNRLIRKHLRPVPRVAWGAKLASSGLVTAMIDVSDGLASDLAHLCEESGCGAEVAAELLPLSRELRTQSGLGRPPLDYALHGGEDYELLFTAPAGYEDRIRKLGVRATVIGAMTRRKGMRLITPAGDARSLPPLGYDHFRAAAGRKGTAR